MVPRLKTALIHHFRYADGYELKEEEKKEEKKGLGKFLEKVRATQQAGSATGRKTAARSRQTSCPDTARLGLSDPRRTRCRLTDHLCFFQVFKKEPKAPKKAKSEETYEATPAGY